MKSSSGKYYIALDHIRAVAAFMVFSWHFIHVNGGQYLGPPIFPLSILSEGHTGVALFMTLSGYLFSKLLDNKKISWSNFYWNRIIRLLPLLLFVSFVVYYYRYHNILRSSYAVIASLFKASLPNGGWSIVVEFHFYFILPLLLFLKRKVNFSIIYFVAIPLLIRLYIYYYIGTVQKIAYWTIIGRIDQFLLGIFAYDARRFFAKNHVLTIMASIAFLIYYYWFDMNGGFYNNISYPSPSYLWIFMPTIEGFFYGIIIAWYDNSFVHSRNYLSKLIASIGTYSYSIYLLHFFVVFKMAKFIDEKIISLNNLNLSLLFAVPSFILIMPMAFISFKFIESPFLRFRKLYIMESESAQQNAPPDRYSAGAP